VTAIELDDNEVLDVVDGAASKVGSWMRDVVGHAGPSSLYRPPAARHLA